MNFDIATPARPASSSLTWVYTFRVIIGFEWPISFAAVVTCTTSNWTKRDLLNRALFLLGWYSRFVNLNGENMVRRISVILLISLVSVSCSSSPNSEQDSSTNTAETETQSSNTSYSLDEAGLNLAATDCANEVLAVNDATDPDPLIQDAMISKVAECIVEKNSDFICSFGADPVCVWDSKAVKGPRVRLMDGVYNAFKAAGSPYFP